MPAVSRWPPRPCSDAPASRRSRSTKATLNLEQVDGNWTITTVHLEMTAKIPGIDAAKFQEIAADAKLNCVVSRALKATLTLEAHLTH
jgi:osmotically inducible protein OsmC